MPRTELESRGLRAVLALAPLVATGACGGTSANDSETTGTNTSAGEEEDGDGDGATADGDTDDTGDTGDTGTRELEVVSVWSGVENFKVLAGARFGDGPLYLGGRSSLSEFAVMARWAQLDVATWAATQTPDLPWPAPNSEIRDVFADAAGVVFVGEAAGVPASSAATALVDGAEVWTHLADGRGYEFVDRIDDALVACGAGDDVARIAVIDRATGVGQDFDAPPLAGSMFDYPTAWAEFDGGPQLFGHSNIGANFYTGWYRPFALDGTFGADVPIVDPSIASEVHDAVRTADDVLVVGREGYEQPMGVVRRFGETPATTTTFPTFSEIFTITEWDGMLWVGGESVESRPRVAVVDPVSMELLYAREPSVDVGHVSVLAGGTEGVAVCGSVRPGGSASWLAWCELLATP